MDHYYDQYSNRIAMDPENMPPYNPLNPPYYQMPDLNSSGSAPITVPIPSRQGFQPLSSPAVGGFTAYSSSPGSFQSSQSGQGFQSSQSDQGGFQSSQSGQGLEDLQLDDDNDNEEDVVPVEDVRSGYTPAEDEQLAKVWVDISEDLILGNCRSVRNFWEAIVARYNETHPEGRPGRNYNQLISHWKRLNQDVQKFCRIYGNLEKERESGSSVADILENAYEIYNTIMKKPFKYGLAWRVLKDNQKWLGGGSVSKRTKHTASGKYSSGGSSLGSPTDTQFSTGASNMSRPMGTKQAKRKAKGKASASASASGPASNVEDVDAAQRIAEKLEASKKVKQERFYY